MKNKECNDSATIALGNIFLYVCYCMIGGFIVNQVLEYSRHIIYAIKHF